MTDATTPPKPSTTSAQRQAALRARRAEQGLTQFVVFAHPQDHKAIKMFADKLTAKRGKGTKP